MAELDPNGDGEITFEASRLVALNAWSPPGTPIRHSIPPLRSHRARASCLWQEFEKWWKVWSLQNGGVLGSVGGGTVSSFLARPARTLSRPALC